MVSELVQQFRLLPDPPDVFDRWRAVVVDYEVSGKRAHDARLVAFMRGHGIERVVTFNAKDFRSFEGLEVIVPT